MINKRIATTGLHFSCDSARRNTSRAAPYSAFPALLPSAFRLQEILVSRLDSVEGVCCSRRSGLVLRARS